MRRSDHRYGLWNWFRRVATRDIPTGVILGSCYISKKNILYITTGDVRVDADPDRFETNICLLILTTN